MAADKQVEWQWAEVVECGDVADGVRRIVLAPERPVRVRPGEHVDVRVELGGGGAPGADRASPGSDERSYSIVDADDGLR